MQRFEEQSLELLTAPPPLAPAETPSRPLSSATAPALQPGALALPPVQLVNILASFTLGDDIDLRAIVVSARNAEYNPKKLNAATIRFRDLRMAATIFACGRVNLCGAASVEDIRYHAKFVTKLAKKCGHPNVKCQKLKIDSLAFSAACGFPVRLENLAADHAGYCNYEPETYCGLIYRYQVSDAFKATALIYVSGRMLITGCRKPSQAREVYHNLYKLLFQYRF